MICRNWSTNVSGWKHHSHKSRNDSLQWIYEYLSLETSLPQVLWELLTAKIRGIRIRWAPNVSFNHNRWLSCFSLEDVKSDHTLLVQNVSLTELLNHCAVMLFGHKKSGHIVKENWFCNHLSNLSLHMQPLSIRKPHSLAHGFPNWGTCTARGEFAYLKGYI